MHSDSLAAAAFAAIKLDRQTQSALKAATRNKVDANETTV